MLDFMIAIGYHSQMSFKINKSKVVIAALTGFVLLLLLVITAFIISPARDEYHDQVQERWISYRINTASDIFTSQMVRVNELNQQTNKITGYLTDEMNKPNPDKEKINTFASDAKKNLQKFSDLSTETCMKYKNFIQNDSDDFSQRGEDSERICKILEGYESAAQLRIKGIDALVRSDIISYNRFMDEADELILRASAALNEFQPTTLRPLN